eukprot:g203.t1
MDSKCESVSNGDANVYPTIREIKEMKYRDLQRWCKSNNVKATGKKKLLVSRALAARRSQRPTPETKETETISDEGESKRLNNVELSTKEDDEEQESTSATNDPLKSNNDGDSGTTHVRRSSSATSSNQSSIVSASRSRINSTHSNTNNARIETKEHTGLRRQESGVLVLENSTGNPTCVIPDDFIEQCIAAIIELNIDENFPCSPKLAAAWSMYFLHTRDGHAYEDLDVDSVVNWYFGNGMDVDKSTWNVPPRGFHRNKNSYTVEDLPPSSLDRISTATSVVSSSSGGDPKKKENNSQKRPACKRKMYVVAPTIRNWWWLQGYSRWPYNLAHDVFHMCLEDRQWEKALNSIATSFLQVVRDGTRTEQTDYIFLEFDTHYTSSICRAMLEDTCGCQCTLSSKPATSPQVDVASSLSDTGSISDPKEQDGNSLSTAGVVVAAKEQRSNEEMSRSFILCPTDPEGHSASAVLTYGTEPKEPMLWNILSFSLQCVFLWISFSFVLKSEVETTDDTVTDPSLRTTASNLVAAWLFQGFGDELAATNFVDCLQGFSPTIASYAYSLFYFAVIYIFRDDLTPVYYLWYYHIFTPNIFEPSSRGTSRWKRGEKCRVLDFVSADFDAPSVPHRRFTTVYHHSDDPKARTQVKHVLRLMRAALQFRHPITAPDVVISTDWGEHIVLSQSSLDADLNEGVIYGVHGYRIGDNPHCDPFAGQWRGQCQDRVIFLVAAFELMLRLVHGLLLSTGSCSDENDFTAIWLEVLALAASGLAANVIYYADFTGYTAAKCTLCIVGVAMCVELYTAVFYTDFVDQLAEKSDASYFYAIGHLLYFVLTLPLSIFYIFLSSASFAYTYFWNVFALLVRMSVLGPIACILVDDLHIVSRLTKIASRIISGARSRATSTRSLLVLVATTILFTAFSTWGTVIHIIAVSFVHLHEEIVPQTINAAMYVLLLPVRDVVASNVAFVGFFLLVRKRVARDFSISTSLQMVGMTAWALITFFVLVAEYVPFGTVYRAFIVMRVLNAAVVISVFTVMNLTTILTTMAVTARNKTGWIRRVFFQIAIVIVFGFVQMIWNAGYFVSCILFLAVLYALLLVGAIRHVFYEAKLIVPLPRFMKLSTIGLALATLGGIFVMSFVKSILHVDFHLDDELANLVGLISGSFVWYCSSAAFYIDLVREVYTHEWTYGKNCPEPLFPIMRLSQFQSSGSVGSVGRK